jgi:ABC-type transporter Mla maintaining outer membrane lipid asymmetry ATPase subunit MlaF
MLFFKNKKKVKSAISASEIRFSYGDKEILKNLNLEIKEGLLLR